MTKISKKAKRNIFIVSLIAIVAILMTLVGTGVIGKKKLLEVQYKYPQRRSVVQTVTANGRIQPVWEIKISPEVSGEITELPVIEGQYVPKGTLLCRIKPDTYISMRDRASAALQSSTARERQVADRLEQSRQAYERARQLHEQKALSDAEFEAAETDYKVAQSEHRAARFSVESARASLQEAQENLFKTTLLAPENAHISKLSVELGERVVGTAQMAGTELMRLADLSLMEARVDVSESDIVNVSLRDTAIVYVDAYPDTVFRGVVTRIANSATEARSVDQITNFEVRIVLLKESYEYLITEENPSPFKPGMSVNVDIRTKRVDNAIALPIESITTRTDSTGKATRTIATESFIKPFEAIFVVRGDSAYMERVETGIQDDEYIEVRTPLDDSTRVIVAPYSALTNELRHRMHVKAKPAKR